MPTDEVERAITHTKYAEVARMMGYTVNGLIELCQSVARYYDWRTFGVTRNGVIVDGIAGPHRVAVMIGDNGRYVFSVGPNAYQLTEDARNAQRTRDGIAQAIVDAYHRSRDSETRKVIAGARRSIQREQAEKDQVTEAVSAPETTVIWPVAPRDPRGI